MRPYDAKDDSSTCALKRSHKDIGKNFWILTDGYRVSLAEQEAGSEPKQQIEIPRAVFNQMVDWYMREQKVTKAA